jgi:23S rRNA (adenine2503-C2)-methyltransferase
MSARDLRNLSETELAGFLDRQGEPRWRLGEIRRWLYRKGVSSCSDMTSLPRRLRQALTEEFGIFKPSVRSAAASVDGTVKIVLELADGSPCETVLIPEPGHRTQCLSSQSGCPLGCRFCQTGRLGLVRNLTAAEIVDQWLVGREVAEETKPVRNLVFMGMGEPLLNYDSLRSAVSILTADWGGNFAPGRITVSTAGIVPAVERMGRDMPGVNLAVSLNAAGDELRSRLMPVNRKYPLGSLLKALRDFPRTRKPLTVEYVLLGGVNDSANDARQLARLLRGLRCKVNLIPFNPHSGLPFLAPDEKNVNAFSAVLRKAGYSAPVRRSKGADIAAACGQLGG